MTAATSPELNRPTRTYAEALIERAAAEAKRKGLAAGVFINISDHIFNGRAFYTAEPWATLDSAATDAAETDRYRFTVKIEQDGTAKVLDGDVIRRHGEAVIEERERDESDERRQRRGLVSYGRP